ncbi:Protein of unknown function DUF974 [Nannochloropsis gaditana]|uniref:Trafficking protein particle complex subunit 13 n=3 Tax=Nannochloropsis gaditana TaxID=72520 RepID=W7TGS3_9STRA|nr:Protein of unknown function DUF974 [Nannochloropsis gaditana]
MASTGTTSGPPSRGPLPAYLQPQQHQEQQQQSTSTANPEIFVRRLYKPRLCDQVNTTAGTQLASLSRRMSAGNRGSGAGEGVKSSTCTVLAAELVQSDYLLQPSLTLPEEFGKIYLGETFCAYVSIVNTLPFSILLFEAHASLKASRGNEVQLQNTVATRQADLVGDAPPPVPDQWGGLGVRRDRPLELRPGENLDVVVEHVLQELDWHYLAINLELAPTSNTGTRTGGEAPRVMMKRFKFKVSNPVALTTTQRVLPSGQVLVQAQIKNITERHTNLFLEDVTFLAADRLHSEAVGLAPNGRSALGAMEQWGDRSPEATLPSEERESDPLDCVAAFDRHVYLQPEDVAQFLYRLSYRAEDTRGPPDQDGMQASSPVARTTLSTGTPLGQLRVSWRTTLGESGTLLSPLVECSSAVASTAPPVELRLSRPLRALRREGDSETSSVDVKPAKDDQEGAAVLVQGQVYAAHCTLYNNTDKDIWLQVQFHLDAMQGVYITGKSFQNAGQVRSHGTQNLLFHFLPLMAGLHDVKGITILDMVTAQEYHQDRLCQVMVLRRSESVGQGLGSGKVTSLPALPPEEPCKSH